MKTREIAVVGMLAAMLLSSSSLAQDPKLESRLAEIERKMDGLAAAREQPAESQSRIGGYGELHYNNLNGRGGASDKEELDFHRFVLFFSHEFNSRIRFNSELELEHSLAGDDQPGEVELEQAFIDLDINENHSARAGLFLLPVGLLNQSHEPNTFFGVERNPVENNILPTTWWEGGAGLRGEFRENFSYEALIHSGLNTSTATTYSVRSGRQKVAKASASDPAATLALNWNVPGILLGGSIQYQSDITQGDDSSAGSAVMMEAHADISKGRFGTRAVYAEWVLNGDGPEAAGADRQYGWYVEPSLKISDHLGIFSRYSEWDNQAGSDSPSRKSQIDAGINWWPVDQVAFKADYQIQDNRNGKEQNGINIGMGYEF